MEEDIEKMLRERAIRVLSNHKPPYKLDLACGNAKKEGYLGVDLDPAVADICWDLTKFPWPFDDNSVSDVWCGHFIEHLVSDDFIFFMNELYRVCKDDAKLVFLAPYWASQRAWQDPTHTRGITEMTMLYWDKAWRKSVGINYTKIKSDFKMLGVQYTWAKQWVDAPEQEKNFAREHFINVIGDIFFMLECIKEVDEDAKN